jgi:restriction endonuclease S subunit
LLEGLEVQEVLFSIPLKSELIRLESEFYTAKSFNLKFSFLGDEIIDFVQYGTSEELNEEKEGYPVLRLNEFQSSFVGIPAKYCKIIDNYTFESLKLKKDDVLICRTNGNPKLVGKSGIVTKDYEYAYASYLFKIRTKKDLINGSTLNSFLNSKYGRLEIEKFSMASNQVNFSPAKFREMRIPKLGSIFNNLVQDNTYKSFDILEESQKLYKEAETILLQSIGLQNLKSNSESVNIKGFRESFGLSGRLDAEYYQKKFDELERQIMQTGEGVKLGTLLQMNKRGSQPTYIEDANGLPVLNSKHIRENKIDFSHNRTGDINETNAELIIRKNDVLINGTGVGTIGRCAVYMREEPALPDNHVTILRTNEIDPVFLALMLNSSIGKMQVDKYFKGSSGQIELYPADINEFVVWKAPEVLQKKIRASIEEAESLSQQSEHLLEVAKKAVEMAIEEGEERAMEWVSNQVDDKLL